MRHGPTNIELVTYLMEFNDGGMLIQPLIIEAIRAYCTDIVQSDKPKGWNNFISWDAWKATAADCLKRLEEEEEKRR